MSQDEDLAGEPPASINPYQVLEVDDKATADEIKGAYRKKALKHHPDKAAPDRKEEAKQKFQEIAFAYAILSDERRRRRYDLTGNTSESLDLEDDDFNWTEFYKEQVSGLVDVSAIEKIKKEYQNTEEERKDLLAAFEQFKGDLDRVYEVVMLSSVLEDDDRFRAILDKAIADGEVTAWKKYTEESESKRQKRLKRAQAEAAEAEEAAQELDAKSTAKGKKKSKPSKGDDNALAALIQQRQKSRAANFFDDLEAKYAPKSAGKAKKRSAIDEPPEEAFAAVGARKSAGKGKGSSKRSKA